MIVGQPPIEFQEIVAAPVRTPSIMCPQKGVFPEIRDSAPVPTISSGFSIVALSVASSFLFFWRGHFPMFGGFNPAGTGNPSHSRAWAEDCWLHLETAPVLRTTGPRAAGVLSWAWERYGKMIHREDGG